MFFNKEELNAFRKKNKINSKESLNDFLRQINKEVVEAFLEGEMTDHIGYENNSKSEKDTTNRRNGYTPKNIKTSNGEVQIEVPRDRESEFEPIIVKKRESDISGFEDKSNC